MAKQNLNMDRINNFVSGYKGETGLNPVNVRMQIPDGHYYGKLCIDADGLPKTEVIPLAGKDALFFVKMDITDLDGAKEYKSVNCSFNTSFEDILTSPQAWNSQFNLDCITRTSKNGKYSALTVNTDAEVEA